MPKIDPRKGEIERGYLNQDKLIAGVDEVGRGCLAGPVVASSIVLDYNKLYALEDKERELIRDSKKLSHNQRAKIIPLLKEIAIAYGTGWSTAREIEELGIQEATFMAMRRALASMEHKIDMLLVDGNRRLSQYKGDQRTVVSGDSLCFNISAASILAKESRDAYMLEASQIYAPYGFDSHVGYGTAKHIEAINAHGICQEHRRNFAPIKNMHPLPEFVQ